MMKTQIYVSPENALYRRIELQLMPNGKLRMEGVDMGELVEEWWGDYDYEYFITIAAEDKDKLLFNLLKDKYAGHDTAVQDFRSYLEDRKIPYDWLTWA